MGNDNIVLRLTLNDDLTQVIAKKEYILQSPLNPENPFFNKIDNTLFICTRNEILKYVKMSDKFIPFSELENLLEGPQKYDYLSIDPYKTSGLSQITILSSYVITTVIRKETGFRIKQRVDQWLSECNAQRFSFGNTGSRPRFCYDKPFR